MGALGIVRDSLKTGALGIIREFPAETAKALGIIREFLAERAVRHAKPCGRRISVKSRLQPLKPSVLRWEGTKNIFAASQPRPPAIPEQKKQPDTTSEVPRGVFYGDDN